MAKPKTEELQKHTLNLRKGDMEKLAILFPKHQPSTMARRIISKMIDKYFNVEERLVDFPAPTANGDLNVD